jgi:hypothetical protein
LAVVQFTPAKAKKVADYLRDHIGDLKAGNLDFDYEDHDFPIGPSEAGMAHPGGGYDNICEAVTTLVRATLETRLWDEGMPVPAAGAAVPAFLRGLTPWEHPMGRVVNQFVATFRANSDVGGVVAREVARRITKLVNEAYDHANGRGRS